MKPQENAISQIAYEMNSDIIQKAEKDLAESLSDYIIRGDNPHGMNFKSASNDFGKSLYKSMVKK